jgi:signal transduction histidine kinase
MRIIRRAGLRLLELVDDIRDFSSLIAERAEYDEHPVDLVAVAMEVAQTTRGQLGKKKIEIVFDPPDTAVQVPGSRKRIWQIMTNLVSNGIKFTEQGEVRIAVEKTGDGKAAIEVKDTGIGIPVGDQKAIFDPFQQHGEMSMRRKGTGLGLAICKRLVDLHSGSIEVSSVMGKGSSFRVILPLER